MVLFSSCNLSYSLITLLSALIEDRSKYVISRCCYDVALLMATYDWPHANIEVSNETVVCGNVKPCVLWTVSENAFCKGNCVRLAEPPSTTKYVVLIFD